MSGRGIRFLPNLVAIVILGALGVTLLQCVPLPKALLEMLSPGAAEVYAVTIPDGAFLPLSLDVPATAHWVIKLLALYAGAVMAPVLFGTRDDRRWIIAAVATSGLVLLVLSLMTAGVVPGTTPLRGPINNPNHAATFFGLASLLAGAGWTRDDEPRWPLYAIACVACGAAVLLTLSRGAALSFVVATVAALVVWYRGSRRRKSVGLALAAAAIALAGLVFWIVRSESAWAADQVDKTQLWPLAMRMIPSFPWVGIGRGAFATVFTRYNEFPLDVTFTHAENEYLQAIIDLGVPFALIMMGLLAFQVLSIIRRARRRVDIVLIVALLFVASRELVDFGSTRLAISLPCVFIMSALASDRRPRMDGFRGWRALLVPVGVALLLVASAAQAIPFELGRDTRVMAALPYDAHSAARRILERHPADFVLRALRVSRGLESKALDRALWHDLNAVLFLAPMHATPHRLTGRALFMAGHHAQALSEYRTAIHIDRAKTSQIIEELARTQASDDELASLGDEPAAREPLGIHFLRRHQPGRVLAVLGELDEKSSAVAVELTARAALELGDVTRALDLAGTLIARAPNYHAGYEVEYRARSRLGDSEQAEAILARGTTMLPTSRELAQLAVERALAGGRAQEARGLAQGYLMRAGSAADMAQAHVWIASSHEQEGNLSRAMRDVTRAAELAPDDAVVRVSMVRLLCAMGDAAGAQRELAVARRILGDTDALKALEALVARTTDSH
ncbi:MAG: O-antigen ligase family protein [Myxococcota bacterium]